MKGILSLLFWAAIIYVAIVLFKKAAKGKVSKSSENDAWPVGGKKTLLSPVEQIVFNRLTEAFPDWIVLAQVALSQMVVVLRTEQKSAVRNRIDKKVVDFVICRPDTSVVAAIELDGASHQAASRSKSDDTKSRVLEAAGIPLIRINTKDLPSGQKLREYVNAPF